MIINWLKGLLSSDNNEEYTVVRAKPTYSGPDDTYNRVVAKNADGEFIYFNTEEDLAPGDVVREQK